MQLLVFWSSVLIMKLLHLFLNRFLQGYITVNLVQVASNIVAALFNEQLIKTNIIKQQMGHYLITLLNT